MGSLTKPVIYFSGLGLLLACILPYLDKSFNPQSPIPGPISFVGITVGLTLLLAAALNYGLQNRKNYPRLFLIYFVLFNMFIFIAKFTIAPWNMYLFNQQGPFDAGFGFLGLIGQNGSIALGAIVVAAVVFFLYYLVFLAIKQHYQNKLKAIPPFNTEHAVKNARPKREYLYFAIAIGAFVLYLALTGLNSLLLLPAFITFFGSANYIAYIFSSSYGIVIPGALLFAVFLLGKAFGSTIDHAKQINNAALFVSFSWLVVAFLISFQAIWIVYLFVLTSLWPLRVYVPK